MIDPNYNKPCKTCQSHFDYSEVSRRMWLCPTHRFSYFYEERQAITQIATTIEGKMKERNLRPNFRTVYQMVEAKSYGFLQQQLMTHDGNGRSYVDDKHFLTDLEEYWAWWMENHFSVEPEDDIPGFGEKNDMKLVIPETGRVYNLGQFLWRLFFLGILGLILFFYMII